MNNHKDWLTVGKIVAAQGLKGELRVNPSSEFPERFTRSGKRWLQSKSETPREIRLLSGRQLPGKMLYVVKFAEINNRSAAEALIGLRLLVPSSDRPILNDGEFHFLDLIALEARLSPKGSAIGNVSDLTSIGNDLLEIELLNGKTVLVPFVKEIVPTVHINEGWLLITPPPGLLDL